MTYDGQSRRDHDVREWALSLVALQPSLDGRGIADQLQRLCRASVAGLHMTGAAVTVRSADGSEAVAAASDGRSRGLAEVELGVGEGPARDAFDLGRPVLVPELGGSRDDAWHGYSPAAHAAGIGAVFAFPLQVGLSRFGVLTMFCDAPRRLDQREVFRGLVMSEVATEMLLDSSAASVDGEIDPNLKSALGFRGEIYQAQGMVMVSLGVALPEALARMRAHSYAAERDLIDVSVDILEGRLALTDDRHHA